MPPLTFSVYVGRQFLIWLGVTLAACCFAALLVDFGETLRITSQNDEIGFSSVLGLTFLKFPNLVQEILPFAFLFSTIAYLAHLGRTNELIIARSAGISVWQFLTPILLAALSIGLLIVILWQPFAAFTTSENKALEKTLIYGERNQFTVSDNGLWLRENIALNSINGAGSGTGYAILHALNILSSDPLILQNAIRFTFNRDDKLIERIDAKTAHLAAEEWIFKDTWVTSFGVTNFGITNSESNNSESNNSESNNSESNNFDNIAAQKDEITRATSFEGKQIRENFVPPRAISLWQFPNFINIAKSAGFQVENYRVYFHSLLARPFLFCAMILIAAAFSLHYNRTGGGGKLVLLAAIVGLGIYFFITFMNTFGNTGLLHPAIAVWIPIIIASLIGTAMLLHQEEG
ncbi:MAG: LptF/LptG family permease [Alphaproteobacteria bacterium]|nr:LptF/LptG family permease [Alphaproteobacteria bacterium]